MRSDPRPTVWIIDDAAAVRESMAAVLETADIIVRDYGSAAEFLSDFTPDATGCLVVDHHMPGMTGLELLIHLRKQGIGIPVIVMTGQGDEALQKQALQAGAVTMLHKPVNGNELMSLIRGGMANKS